MEARATSPLWYASHCQEVGYHSNRKVNQAPRKSPPTSAAPAATGRRDRSPSTSTFPDEPGPGR